MMHRVTPLKSLRRYALSDQETGIDGSRRHAARRWAIVAGGAGCLGDKTIIWVNIPETIFWFGAEVEAKRYTICSRAARPATPRFSASPRMGMWGAELTRRRSRLLQGMLAVMEAIEEVGNYPISEPRRRKRRMTVILKPSAAVFEESRCTGGRDVSLGSPWAQHDIVRIWRTNH